MPKILSYNHGDLESITHLVGLPIFGFKLLTVLFHGGMNNLENTMSQ